MEETQKEEIGLMRRLIYGNWQSCVTSAFAELGIADILYNQPLTLSGLAGATGIAPGLLLRFLRCCAALGFIEFINGQEEIRLTEFGEYLRSGHPYSQRDAARLNGAPYRYEPWGKLAEILREGEGNNNASLTYEHGTLAYLKDKPEMREVFHKAMINQWAIEDEQIVAAYDFSPFTHIMDIGAGHGTFIKTVLKTNPHIHGTMFDLKETFADSDVSQNDMQGRLSLFEGNFFESIPGHADIYTMKNVLHNWPDSKVFEILRNAHKAITSGANAANKHLLVIEYLVPEDNAESIVNWMDLNFFITVGGSDHTLKEYKELFAKCGFVIHKTISTAAGRTIIDLVAA